MPEPCVDGLLRELAPQVLGAVVRRYGHFDTAEDATQEALLAAATQWPAEGIPDSPRGWLITVAGRRLTDLLRREQARQRREDAVARQAPPGQWLAPAAGGLATAEIARAFLVPESAMTRRISRANQQIKDSGVPFQVPAPAERAERLVAV